jgi:hypothetical protein
VRRITDAGRVEIENYTGKEEVRSEIPCAKLPDGDVDKTVDLVQTEHGRKLIRGSRSVLKLSRSYGGDGQ